MKNIWKNLKPFYKNKIRENTHQFASAKRLKYKLMAAGGWYDLSLRDIQSILTYTDKYTHEVTAIDLMYGDEFLKQEDNE